MPTTFFFLLLAHPEGDGFCEISPLVSYFGEGLKDYVEGKTITLPYLLERIKS
jgi:hypothetical protein